MPQRRSVTASHRVEPGFAGLPARLVFAGQPLDGTSSQHDQIVLEFDPAQMRQSDMMTMATAKPAMNSAGRG